MDTVAGMRSFLRVVETGSFSGAGRQLGRAPSSVSRQITELEDMLGVRLFHRTTRKLSLTEAGRLYHERAIKVLDAVDEANLAVAEIKGAPSGVLRLTAPQSMSRPVAAAIAAFHGQVPAVRVVLALTDRVVDLVDEGYDLALRVGRQRDSSLVARKIGDGRRRACASPAYFARAGRPEGPEDLSTHNCLSFRPHPGHNVWRFRRDGETSEVRVTGSLFAENGEALAAAALAGLGIVLLPEWLVGGEIARGRLHALLEDHEAVPATTPLYAVYPHQRHLPAKVRAFIDFLVGRFSGRSGWDAAQQPDVNTARRPRC